MSSYPGRELEDYLMWLYDLVNDEISDDPNPSLRIAEALGTATTRRPHVSKEQFGQILEVFEPYREQIEYWLSNFDDDTMSWRDYAGYGGIDDLPKEVQAQALAKMNEVTGRNWTA